MSKIRVLVVLVAAVSLTACASAPFKKGSAVSQFGTGPMAFSQNPRMLSQLNQTYITNEAELESAARRIEEGQLEVIEAEEAVSARSAISPL